MDDVRNRGPDSGYVSLAAAQMPLTSRAERSVLIVEDEALIAFNLETLVEDLGHRVVGVVPDAATGWEQATRAPPAIAIVDLNLLDGRTGLALATNLIATLGTLVIVATGNPEDVSADSPIFEVVRKPYTNETVAKAIERAAAVLDADLSRVSDPGTRSIEQR